MARLRNDVVQALLNLAKDSAGARNIIVNCSGVQRHLINISEQLQEHRMRSDQPMARSGSTAIPTGSWPHGLGGAPGTEDHLQACPQNSASSAAEVEVTTPPHMVSQPECPPSRLTPGEPTSTAGMSQSILSTEPPLAGQSDALLYYLMTRARDQQEAREPLPADYATEEWARVLEEEVQDWDSAEPPEQPRRQKAKARCKKSKVEGEEPLRAGDTALIVKGIHAQCGRDDVYAMLEESGFINTFDILHVPKNFVSHQNKGYFHVNFREAADAEAFSRLLQSSPSGSAAKKVIAKPTSRLVAHRARYQGLCNFVVDLLSSRKLRAENREHLPWVYLLGSSRKGYPLTKEVAERLVSSEFHWSGDSPPCSSNATP